MDEFKKVGELFPKSKCIGLCSHVRPDGDAFGSVLALGLSLKKMGMKVRMFNPDGMNDVYRFLPCANDLEKTLEKNPPQCDLWVALDTSTKERLGDVFQKWNFEVDINLDHHISSTKFGKLNLIRPDLPSTASLVQELIEKNNMPMDDQIASNLFVGVSTDTGSFRYRGTTAETFLATARLIQAGADCAELAKKCYQSVSLARFELHRLALETFTLECSQKLAHAELTQEMFQKSGAQPSDTEGLVEKLQEIDPVQIAAIFQFGKDYMKVSLRSKGSFDVNSVAQAFGGGGHTLAAGITMSTNVRQNKENVLNHLRKLVA